MIVPLILLCALIAGALILLAATAGSSTPVIHAEICEPVSRSFTPGEPRWAYVAGRRRVYVRDSVLHEDREMLIITGTGDPRQPRPPVRTLSPEPVTAVVKEPTTRRAIAAYRAIADQTDAKPLVSVYA